MSVKFYSYLPGKPSNMLLFDKFALGISGDIFWIKAEMCGKDSGGQREWWLTVAVG